MFAPPVGSVWRQVLSLSLPDECLVLVLGRHPDHSGHFRVIVTYPDASCRIYDTFRFRFPPKSDVLPSRYEDWRVY